MSMSARALLSALLALLPRRITLSAALSISLALHALLLAIHFEVPSKLVKASDQMLEVILVNARTQEAPPASQVQARAQVNLDGGGNTDEKRIAKTPLPATQQTRQGNDLIDAQRKIAEMEALQRQLMSQIKSREKLHADQRQQLQKSKTSVAEPPSKGSELAASAMAMARLQGQIERQFEDYNKRPRKKFIGARATEYRFAQYEEDWRQKIERVGNLNYPQAARGRLYGTLVLTVEINADGSIHTITIDRTSGSKVLDQAAMRIVNQAAPFPAFPPNLDDVDIIGITRTWSFTNEDRLQAR